MNACVWAQDGDGEEMWATGCGRHFSLNEGTPTDNRMKFCCYCGGTLVEHAYKTEPEDDE